MFVIIAYVFLGFLIIRVIVSLINGATYPLLKNDSLSHTFGVSVLIPARNEEVNMERLLYELTQQDYPNIEIIVYDDLSTDQTALKVQEMAQKDARVKLVSGIDLPVGWLGKNNACHQLSLQAQYPYLLFIDADVMVQPNLISSALGYMQKKKLLLLSLFPQQKMETFGEYLTVPLINRILTSLLPIFLIKTRYFSSLSAANGQFMLFKADVYHQYHFHQMVKNSAVEDIKIIRRMKKMKLKTQTLLSGGQIACRMYQNYCEAINGFSKNVFYFFGNNFFFSLFYITSMLLGWIMVGVYLGWMMLFIYLILNILIVAVTSKISLQSVSKNIALSYLQQWCLLWIMIQALQRKINGRLEWKGRLVQ